MKMQHRQFLNLNSYISTLHFRVYTQTKFVFSNLLKFVSLELSLSLWKMVKCVFMQFKIHGQMKYKNYYFIVWYTIWSTLVFPPHLEARIPLFLSSSPWNPLVMHPTHVLELVHDVIIRVSTIISEIIFLH